MAVIKYRLADGVQQDFEVDEQTAFGLMEIERESQREQWRYEWRKRKKETSFDALSERGFPFSSDKPSPEEVYIRKGMHELLHKAICSLSQEQQTLIRRVFFEGVTRVQVAAEYGISEGAIRSRLSTIFEKLKKVLKSSYDLSSPAP